MKTPHPTHCKAAALLGMLALLSTCKTYEEGPPISLRGVEKRIAGHWRVDSYTVNGADSMRIIRQLHLEEDWDFQPRDKTNTPVLETLVRGDTLYRYSGNWNPNPADKENTLAISFSSASTVVRVNGNLQRFSTNPRVVLPGRLWKILRLKHRKDIWLQLDENGKRYELRFKPN